jgi:uncharacterized protein YndB with AHSA1/START domain
MQDAVTHTKLFSQVPETVWEYLTKPELLEQWLGKTDFKPVAGHKFRFFSPYGNDSICEVVEVKPVTKLSYSWQKKSAVNNSPFNSLVVWTLVPKGNGTELQLMHTGFSALDDYTAHDNGWSACFTHLETLFKTNSKTI